jgi:hypothetical protein
MDNCNNGNCNCGSNCYDYPQNCVNCYSAQCIAGNCDAAPGYLQNNCNCDNGATYNCNVGQWQNNCNCIPVNCADCACQCK